MVRQAENMQGRDHSDRLVPAAASSSRVSGNDNHESSGRSGTVSRLSGMLSSVRRSSKSSESKKKRMPWGYKWRSSAWYITAVVGVGVCSDALTYQIIVPVLPYRLQSLGYTNVSEKVSWLAFAYSIGIFVSTFPVAYYFGRYPYRRLPLVAAVIILEAAQILFMLAKPYAALVIARFLMGAASTVVWVVGFALICENVDEARIGRQIGFAVSGVSIGTTIAPPIGGALYWNLGWYSPFIFTIAFLAVDTAARMLVIERKQMMKYESAKTTDMPLTATPESTTHMDGDEKARPDLSTDPEAAIASRDRSPASTRVPKIPDKVKSDLTPWQVVAKLGRSSRGMNGVTITFIFGFVLGALDPTLTLRVQSVWHKNSAFVGLVYLAASAPTFITGPIIGALADKYGAEWIMAPSLLLSAPWLPLLILKNSLPGFIVYFALSQTFFSCALGPVGLELAMAAREVEGMSEIHQFSAMNLAFSISSAIGSVVGGQMYDRLNHGWEAVCWFMFAVTIVFIPLPFLTAGKRTLWDRCRGRPGKSETDDDGAEIEASEDLPHRTTESRDSGETPT
ncbi:major facilitator superfamily domain-containing protein [Kockovaella imperatae]|uniref:Major facilitator superfamily domain-containing protein n=1 Tax=Kockovaella imperatae TaxID=4999 RepID=A0A1Y1UIC1_9TREE|nr:major facilitator superfamily domain-containing protein [Kockovaella imperatae]ORX37801.1 major facilitator superfamily domain-containing protein [Kockovaella imperatae]